MSGYGRNFGFLSPPKGSERSARHYSTETSNFPIGAPVVRDNSETEDAVGRMPMALATGAQAKPLPGLGGIAVFEHIEYRGDDPALTVDSDKDYVPAGAAFQVVSGTGVEVWLKNTDDSDFLESRSYAGRIMTAGVSLATPTVVVGDMLTPGTGDDNDGYWAETGTAANGWLVVTHVDASRDEVQARLTF